MEALHHDVTGTGSPMLLIHGTGADGTVWRAARPTLARGHRVISYDRRGHGRSPGPAPSGGEAHLRHAEDGLALLGEHARREPAVLVGWSSGGIIALQMAALRPDRVRALVLVEPPLWARNHQDMRMLWAMLPVFWHRKVRPRQAAAAFYRAVCRYHDDAGGNGFDALPDARQEAILANADAIMAELTAGTGEALTPELLRARVHCPVTLLLGGRSPPMFRRVARELGRVLPQLQTATIADAGHLMMIESPAAFAAWVHAVAAGPGGHDDAFISSQA
jgi:pimeloyl-ACP methyl ester carboxylesterase